MFYLVYVTLLFGLFIEFLSRLYQAGLQPIVYWRQNRVRPSITELYWRSIEHWIAEKFVSIFFISNSSCCSLPTSNFYYVLLKSEGTWFIRNLLEDIFAALHCLEPNLILIAIDVDQPQKKSKLIFYNA